MKWNLIPRRERLWHYEIPSANDVHRLSTYNSEVNRGLVHTEAYQREMSILQQQYDLARRP